MGNNIFGVTVKLKKSIYELLNKVIPLSIPKFCHQKGPPEIATKRDMFFAKRTGGSLFLIVLKRHAVHLNIKAQLLTNCPINTIHCTITVALHRLIAKGCTVPSHVTRLTQLNSNLPLSPLPWRKVIYLTRAKLSMYPTDVSLIAWYAIMAPVKTLHIKFED